MKITAPDVFVDDNSLEEKSKKDVCKSFEQEIKEILKPPKLTSKYVVNQEDLTNSYFILQVLHKFVKLCREEIIPRHIKASEAIQLKEKMIQFQLDSDQQHLAYLAQQRVELEESTKQLQVKQQLVLSNHQALKERLKETLRQLQDQCKNKTAAENKLSHDLKYLEKRTECLKASISSFRNKWDYYNEQVNAQNRMVEKYSKPGYLDKNRVVFLRTNLKMMLENIEELVRRTKILKEKTSELTEFECAKDSSYIIVD